MKHKQVLFYIAIIIGFIVGVFYLITGLTGLFNVKFHELISYKQMESIKTTVASGLNKSEYLTLDSIQGSSDYIALTYKDVRYSGKENIFNILYDVQNSTTLTNIQYKDININIYDSISVTHIKDNVFIIISSSGNIYNVNLSNGKIILIDKLDISKKTYFKSIYSNNSLFIITRHYYSNYNEKLLNNSLVYEIEFQNSKYTKAAIKTYDFSDKVVFSFVTNLFGDIGVTYSSYIHVSGEEVANNKLTLDDSYLNTLPTENQQYKFLSSSDIKVSFLKSGSEYPIPSQVINNEYINIHHNINKNLNIHVSSPSNIPFVFDNNISFYFDSKYEDVLYDLGVYPTSSILISTDSSLENSDFKARTELLLYNYKKYVAFISTNDGLVAIDKHGNTNVISKYKIVYPHKKYMLYINNGAVNISK